MLDRFLDPADPSHEALIMEPDVAKTMIRELGPEVSSEEHLKTHIFGGSWWPNAPANKVDILRAAYREAVKRATASGNAKRIVTYHIKGLPETVFEVMVGETADEVHVLWLSPMTPMPDTKPGPLLDQGMMLFGSEARVSSVHQHYLELGYDPGEVPAVTPAPDIAGVFSLECKTY
jgi:hypothetical protein